MKYSARRLMFLVKRTKTNLRAKISKKMIFVLFVPAFLIPIEGHADIEPQRLESIEKGGVDIKDLVIDIQQAEEIEAINNGTIGNMFSISNDSRLVTPVVRPGKAKSTSPAKNSIKKGRVALR